MINFGWILRHLKILLWFFPLTLCRAKQSFNTDPWIIRFGGFGVNHYNKSTDHKERSQLAQERFLQEFPAFELDGVTGELTHLCKLEVMDDPNVPPISLVQLVINHLLRWNSCSRVTTDMSVSQQYGSKTFMWTLI